MPALHLTYVLLSPTFGMHQYTADLANRAAAGAFEGLSCQVITTSTLRRDRYSDQVRIQTPVATRGTGFALEGLHAAAYRRVLAAICASTAANSAACHFTGVHLWNVPLVHALRLKGVPVIHTLHDLDPHHGVRFGAFIRLWDRLIVASGCHLLVHGARYRDLLLAQGVPPERVTCVPLLHGFLSGEHAWPPENEAILNHNLDLRPVLFFARVEPYKGVDTLLAAWPKVAAALPAARLVIAGPVAQGMALPPLPPSVALRDRRVLDGEALELFRSASLVVLPYRDATQSALVAAAYAFQLPVIVTRSGALPEYVVPGETGWVVPPDDPPALAAALRSALSDSARLRRMGVAGRRWLNAQRRAEQAAISAMYARTVCASPTPPLPAASASRLPHPSSYGPTGPESEA